MKQRFVVAVVAAGLTVTMLQGCAGLILGGAAATAVVAQDRRTFGSMIEDQSIEFKAADAFRDDEELAGNVHIQVTSYNGVVLLTGEAPDEALKARADALVRDIDKVRRVHNEITLAAPSSSLSRSNDALLASKVKTKLLSVKGQDNFSPLNVKIVAENDTVYLMGLLTHEEADAVTQKARQVSGVHRVVKIFEYLD